MADQVFNISKGALIEKVRDSASALELMMLKVAQADDTLNNHDTVSALLAAANTEADFTNYARKTGITGTITVDDTNNRVDLDIPDQTFTAAGGASNNSLVKVVVSYDQGAGDANVIPGTHHDITVTTDGNDLVIQPNAAGIMRAS